MSRISKEGMIFLLLTTSFKARVASNKIIGQIINDVLSRGNFLGTKELQVLTEYPL